MQRDLAPIRRLEHLAHRQLMGAKALTPVHEAELSGRVKEVDHPVHR